jgi:hypothetical protein
MTVIRPLYDRDLSPPPRGKRYGDDGAALSEAELLARLRALHRRLTIHLRTLYSLCRTLPAYQLHRRTAPPPPPRGGGASRAAAAQQAAAAAAGARGPHQARATPSMCRWAARRAAAAAA